MNENGNIIHPSFKYGGNLKMGHFCVIEDGVEVGKNVEICNYVLLKKGTKIGDNCYIDSYVLSSGDCQIGNNVILRYQSIIARNVIIEDDVFFTAGVKTIFLDHRRDRTKKPLVIGKGCFLGDNATIMGGVRVAPNCIIGANALITKDTEPGSVYIGVPARKIRDVTDDEMKSMRNK